MANDLTAPATTGGAAAVTGPMGVDDGELRCPFGGASPGPAPGTRPRPKRGYLVPGIIALVVCATIGIVIDLAGLQSRTPSTLAGRQLDALVSQSLQATHPQRTPPQVRCPATEPERTGLVFDCSLVRPGRHDGVIRVTELSGSGTLHISAPTG
jgi:hypothetical protein